MKPLQWPSCFTVSMVTYHRTYMYTHAQIGDYFGHAVETADLNNDG